jgi:hypothetical protein
MEELRKWHGENVTNCESCNEPRIKQYMYENEEKLILCKNCIVKGSKEKSDSKENTKNDSKSDDKSIDAEIDGRRIMIHKFEVKRLKRLGFNKYYLGSLTFIQKYKENEGKSDEELIEILKVWKKPIEYKDSDTQGDDEEIFIEEKEIIKNILEELEKLNIETNEDEIIRLRSMEFDVIDISKKEFFIRFQKIKDELNSVVKNELEKWLFEIKVQELLKEREEKLTKVTEYEIRELLKWGYDREEIFEEDIIKEYRRLDTEINIYDDNVKEVKERLDNYIRTWKLTKEKGKDEEIELISNISENGEIEIITDDKDEDENELEKLINTNDFGLFEESDSENLNIKPEDINNNNESDLSDYYIENLFEEIDNMAAQQNQVREDMRQAFITLFGHDVGNNWNALIPPAQPIFGAINNVNAAVRNLQDLQLE